MQFEESLRNSRAVIVRLAYNVKGQEEKDQVGRGNDTVKAAFPYIGRNRSSVQVEFWRHSVRSRFIEIEARGSTPQPAYNPRALMHGRYKAIGYPTPPADETTAVNGLRLVTQSTGFVDVPERDWEFHFGETALSVLLRIFPR